MHATTSSVSPARPQTMRAIHVEPDDARSLTWRELPCPSPGPGEVLVEVLATAVNRADLLQRQGLYPPPPGASTILGLECAGVVLECGPGADTSWRGRCVCALLAGGGYATHVVVPQEHLLALPEGLSAEEAAALPEVLITAFVNLFMEAQLEAGQWAIIHAAASGVGTAALQLCHARGVQTLATASAQKRSALVALGATVVVDRHAQDFEQVARQHMPQGAHAILCPIGAQYLERNLRALAPQGSLVLIGLMGGARAELDLGRLLVKRQRVIGSVLRSRSRQEKAQIVERVRREVWPLVEQRAIVPIIHATMPITQAQQAHALLASDTTIGKIVLTVPSRCSRAHDHAHMITRT